MILRRGLGAEHAIAPFDYVEINLEYAALGHDGFHHHRDHGFLRLAPPRALARQEQVLGELLADGRTARDYLAFLEVLLVRLGDAVPVETFMVEELGVLGGD